MIKRSSRPSLTQFPRNVFNPFNHADLRWRISSMCQYLTSLRPFDVLAPKPEADFTYLTLTCRKDLLLSSVSLYSLWKHASSLPRVVVSHDESISTEEVHEAFHFWPAELRGVTRKEIADYHTARDDLRMREFCQRDIFGYKMASCLRESAEQRVLYGDSDVLWFGDVCRLMDEYRDRPLYGTVDPHPSYDPGVRELASRLYGVDMTTRPFVNAGVAIYNDGTAARAAMQDALLNAILAEDPIHQFSEQTVVASVARSAGGVIDDTDITARYENLSLWRPSFRSTSWIGRHYIRPVREQCWIDAFWIK